MDKKTVFVKTSSGENEVAGQSDALYGDAKRILLLVDDESTVAEITKRAPPSLRETINDVLQELVDGSYIKDMRASVKEPKKSTLKMASPAFKMSTPKAEAPAPSTPKPSNIPTLSWPSQVAKNEEPTKAGKGGDLDFSFISSGGSQSKVEASAAIDKVQAASSAKARQQAERSKAEQAAQIEAAASAAKLRAYEEAKIKTQIEVAARSKIEEAARAQQEVDKVQAETAAKARQVAERSKAEQAVQMEAAARAAKLKAYEDAKIKAKIEVAARTKIEEAARAQQEADLARMKAEQVALKARSESDAARSRVEAETRARIEAEARIKQEAIRLKADQEAEKLRLEQEEAKIKAEVEMRARREAEVRVKAEAEARVKAEVVARIKREAEAERLRLEKERAELEVARVKVEAQIKMRAEVEARLEAEELGSHGDRRSKQQDGLSAAGSEITGKVEEAYQAERLRQSFVESFVQIKKKQDVGSSTGSFKLEKFSLINTGKLPVYSDQPVKQQPLPVSGSKVKAVIEERVRKEAEAKRIKTEQESAHLSKKQNEAERIKGQQDEAAARAKAEQESTRLAAEQEAYRLKVTEEQAREKADAEAQKLADNQAKQWEEAQRRAAIQARAEEERLYKQVSDAHAKAHRNQSRVRRKSFPLAKILAGLFVLALVAVAVLPYVWPVDEFIAPLEKEISAKINQPVQIKKINFALLPLPRLVMHAVTVGQAEELKMGDVVMNFDFSALFSPTKSINKVELNNVTVAGSSFDKVLVWLQAAGGVEAYPVAQIELNGVRITHDEIKLPLLSGKADFDTQGKFTHATLKSEDSKYAFEMKFLQNNLLIEINLKETSLPIFSSVKFNNLSTNALVTNGEIVFSDLFAHIHGGTLTGKGRLNWSNGWKLQGQVNARSLELQRMLPGSVLSGEVFGDLNVSMASAALSRLDRDYRIEGSFDAKNGAINKLDLVTIARFGARQGVAGHTNFSELSGTIKADKQGQQIFVSKLASGAANSTGPIEVDSNQQVSGKLQVEIKGLGIGVVPLRLSGTVSAPILQAVR